MKDSPIFLYIHIILLIKSPSNFPKYRRDSPNFYTYKSRGGLKIILGDVLIDHMVNLFHNTFNKKVVAKLARENLKYTRAQYRDKLQLDLKHERPPMVLVKEWKALIEDAKDNLLNRQGKQPWPGKARYNTYHIFSEICSILFFDLF